MRLPIDTAKMAFIAAGEPAPVVDFKTKVARLDESGLPLYQLNLLAVAGPEAEVLSVKVPGEPKGIVSGSPVTVGALVALPYKLTDESGKERTGVAYRAATVTSVRADR